MRAALFGLCLALAVWPALAQSLRSVTIAFPASQEPAVLDGHVDPFQSTWLIDSFIADPLLILDGDGAYKPALAAKWDASADGREWTFTLKPGLTFQDGTPVDAEAVKFNIERILDPKTASAQMKSELGPVQSVEVVDPLTLRVRYAAPWVTLLDAVRRMPVWSPTASRAHSLAEFSRFLVGAGPFQLAEWKPNDRIVLRRWSGYGGWNPAQLRAAGGPPLADQVVIRFIGENAVLGSMVRSNDAQVAFMLPPAAVPDYKDKPGFRLIAQDQAGTGLQMVMNLRRPPLNDVRVRRALIMASNPKAVNDLLFDGLFRPSEGPLNNAHACFWAGNSGMYPFNLDRARALLEEAGWKAVPGKPIREAQGVPGVADGTPLAVRYTVISFKEMAEAFQAQLRRAGIDLKVELVPGPVQLDRVNKREFDLIYLRQRSPDPVILDQIWNSRWDQPGGWAWTGFKDAKLDETVGLLRTLTAPDARCAAAREAQKIIMENAMMFPTLSDPVYIAVSGKVQGFRMGSEGNWFFLHDLALTP